MFATHFYITRCKKEKKMNKEEFIQYIWNEGKGKDQIIKRMVKAYKKNKREKKIDKLSNNKNHWKGLQ